MYVYVTKFEKYPNLIKIGKSRVPEGRTAQLVRWHGDVITTDVFYVGENYTKVESELHRKYKVHQVRTHGDGETEFFSDVIYERVCKALENKDCKESLELSLKKEEIRYKGLIGKLLGTRNRAYIYQGVTGELHSGFMDCLSIQSCLQVGFSESEVFSRFVTGKVHNNFTTPNRVAIAFRLFENGTIKARRLQKLISDCE